MGKIKEEKTRQDRKRRLLILSFGSSFNFSCRRTCLCNHKSYCKSNGYGVGRYN